MGPKLSTARQKLTIKAQILSNLEDYDAALELLEEARALQPNAFISGAMRSNRSSASIHVYGADLFCKAVYLVEVFYDLYD